MLFKVTLHKEDYINISKIVREKLLPLFPDSELAINHSLIFGPEFMAPALRIDTPSTKIQFTESEQRYVKDLRREINNSNLKPEERRRKHQHLDSIILFGQILFAQSSCQYFLEKPFRTQKPNPINPEAIAALESSLAKLKKLAEKEGIQYSSSRFEALSRRQAFNQYLAETKQALKNAHLTPQEEQALLYNLQQAKDFYFQANDFNFKYANKPSRSFSNFFNAYEYYGSKVSLTASLIAIGATALAIIPPLAPIMGPIAIAATCIGLAIGAPLAFKTIGTMLYNLIRFGAAPTPTELATTALVGTTLILMGTGSAVTMAVQQGIASSTALSVTQGFKTVNDAIKMVGSIGGSIMTDQSRQQVNLYKEQLAKMQADEELQPTTTLNAV